MKICVVDERSEIAACHLGIPQMIWEYERMFYLDVGNQRE